MTLAPEATYRCTVCGLAWSYAAVRHLACCRECGSGLVRTLPVPDRGEAPEDGRAPRRRRQPEAPAPAPIRAAPRGGTRRPRPRMA